MVSDQGTNLLSSLMQEVYEITGIHKLSTTTYHPQIDGLVEIFNRTPRAMVAKYAAEYGTEWDEHVPHLFFVYRTKPHESTEESQFFLLYGRDACIPRESALSTKQTPYQVDIDDYKSELVFSLAEACQVAEEKLHKHTKIRAI